MHPHETVPVYVHVQSKKKKSENEAPLAKARLWLMPYRLFEVKIHFVVDDNNFASTKPEGVPLSDDGIIKFKKEIETQLNEIWKQANVQFKVEFSGGIENIAYDGNRNGKLDYDRYDSNDDSKIDDNDKYEYTAIRDPSSLPKDAIHVYYVKAIENMKSQEGETIENMKSREGDSLVLGFTNGTGNFVFISDAGRIGRIDILAHEIGHALGLDHNGNRDGSDNFFRFDYDYDQDRFNTTELMWGTDHDGAGNHIGSPFWRRLNEIRCSRPNWLDPEGCKSFDEYIYEPPY